MSHRKTTMLAVFAATLGLPAAANAAEATVNATAKSAHITGTITDPTSMYDLAGFVLGGTEVAGQDACKQPLCDEHTLHVGPDGAQLKLDATSDAYNIDLEVIAPDGTHSEYNSDTATDNYHLTLDATQGDWTIRVYGAPNSTSFDYDLGFTFRTPDDVAQDPPPADDGE